MKRIYISGPISSTDPDQLRQRVQAFVNKAIELRAAGHHVTNPVENGLPITADWAEHMRADIRDMMDCDTLFLLPGWAASRGARLEYQIARELGFEVEGAEL